MFIAPQKSVNTKNKFESNNLYIKVHSKVNIVNLYIKAKIFLYQMVG